MRILVITNLYFPTVIGGYETNCRNVVGSLRDRGHDVTVLTSTGHMPGTLDEPQVLRSLNSHVFRPTVDALAIADQRAHLADVSDYDNIAVLVGTLRTVDPDIVFLWNLHGLGGLHIVDMLTTCGIPWSIYLGDRVFEQLVNSSPEHVRHIFRGHLPEHFASGQSLAVSNQLVAEIEEMSGFLFPRKPIIVYGYAVTPGPYSDHQYQQDGFTTFAFAGRVDDHKGVGLICEAVSKMVLAGISNFTVNIFGDGETAFYSNYANSMGIADRVVFRGRVSQPALHHEYGHHDAFLFPTWEREPFAFAPFEAAAFGCVPVLTETCGCAERLVDGVHCIKIERTADQLALAMQRIVDGEVDLLALGRAGAALVREDMSFAANVDLIEQCLEQERRPWSRKPLNDERILLLAFTKHHLSLAWRFGQVE